MGQYSIIENLKYWDCNRFETSGYDSELNNRKNKTLNTSGSDQSGLCIYKYNELGFRGNPITNQGFKIMCVGDSNTEGVGVNYEDTWSYQFSRLIPNGVNINFGMGGRSNDFICRTLLSFYDLINPDLVLIMYTSPHRREYYTNDNGLIPFMATCQWGYTEETEEGIELQKNLISIQNDNEDFMNWYKNHLLIKYFLQTKNCNWLWNGWLGVPSIYDEYNRFDGGYGKFTDMGTDNVHPGPNHNRKYSKLLLKHIKDNFENYIPKYGSLI